MSLNAYLAAQEESIRCLSQLHWRPRLLLVLRPSLEDGQQMEVRTSTTSVIQELIVSATEITIPLFCLSYRRPTIGKYLNTRPTVILRQLKRPRTSSRNIKNRDCKIARPRRRKGPRRINPRTYRKISILIQRATPFVAVNLLHVVFNIQRINTVAL